MKYSWMILLLGLLCGCDLESELQEKREKRQEKEKATIRSSYYLSTVVHDEHLFILSSYGYFIHHPDCPCQKSLEKSTSEPKSPIIIDFGLLK